MLTLLKCRVLFQRRTKVKFSFLTIVLSLLTASQAVAKTYEVGPGKKLSAVGDVPWESLEAGDQVHILWRLEPYKEKFVICRQGTEQKPIIIRGIPGPNGELPVIDGNGATTRKQISYWHDVRSVIKIGGARTPADTMPRHIVLENLTVQGGRPANTFTASDGTVKKYLRFAAGIHVEKAENLTIRNCTLRDNANGLFISSTDDQASTNILVEGNYFHDNGTVRGGFEHNAYTTAIGITFQYNHFGPLIKGSVGNNLKDRSVETVIRYNWFASANNVIDLVEGEDSKLIRGHPKYGNAYVYGNVILKETPALHGYIVHFGGDSANKKIHRKGTLYFHNNTLVSSRIDGTLLFRVSTDEPTVDCRNNILYTFPKVRPLAIASRGTVRFSHNWVKTDWKKVPLKNLTCNLIEEGTIVGSLPGFLDLNAMDFSLAPNSPCVNAGTNLANEVSPMHKLTLEYSKHQMHRKRPSDGNIDLGAFELIRPK